MDKYGSGAWIVFYFIFPKKTSCRSGRSKFSFEKHEQIKTQSKLEIRVLKPGTWEPKLLLIYSPKAIQIRNYTIHEFVKFRYITKRRLTVAWIKEKESFLEKFKFSEMKVEEKWGALPLIFLLPSNWKIRTFTKAFCFFFWFMHFF